MSPNFSHQELHKIYTYVRTVIIFNPDDGKQPKTFGSNIVIFNHFNLLALCIEYTLLSKYHGQNGKTCLDLLRMPMTLETLVKLQIAVI